ncbi:hypothetical protein FTUN_0410 [Frigoriglobus tundricola]|uniref:Uncharacterized protein n=1 Tax=Frigoriglobus tundricola TaxID=2774151 RepID=A0A6M5YI31_9BACT|nr:hypothetical protein FTUN_0410 [Frigoriglobus tundricola]
MIPAAPKRDAGRGAGFETAGRFPAPASFFPGRHFQTLADRL